MKLGSRRVIKGLNWMKAKAPLIDNPNEAEQPSPYSKADSMRLPTLECFYRCRSIFWRPRRNAETKMKKNPAPNVHNT